LEEKVSINKPKIKVGNVKEYVYTQNKITGRTNKVPIPYVYKDVAYDIDGWADSEKYLPEDFDLVLMKLARGKTVPGWIGGTTWYGLRFKKDDAVLFWKRNPEETGP
jgi:hypothetical protein